VDRPFIADRAIDRIQAGIYLVVGALLLVAAGFTLIGTVIDVIEGSDSRHIADTGVFILDRVLLLLIMAELLYTLRLVEAGGRILVEPFLFVGLIAVVRKILVVTAGFEEGDADTTDFLVQIGGLAGLAFALTLSIFLLRRAAASGLRA
jgi:uncharacterized membrane protein (DUF373 family)